MRTSMRVNHFLAPTLLTLAALGLGTGCSSTKNALTGGNCSADLTAQANVLTKSVADLQALSVSASASVGHACYQIAKDLDPTNTTIQDVTGGSGDAGGSITSDQVTANCKAAGDAITAAFQLAGTGAVKVSVIAPKCEVDVSAQLDCQGKCNASVSCSAPDIKAQCDPGHLSGTCSGSCTGDCTVTGSLAANCTGTCEGTCQGDCTGTASSGTGQATTANGQCNGTCSGTCQGSCKAAASATASCSGSCTGTCDVEMTAPSCDVALTPPSCSGAADCNASCDTSASMNATCTKPSVAVTVTGNTTLKATLETNLPVLFQLAAKSTDIVAAAADIASQVGQVGASLTTNITTCASLAGQFAANVQASLAASANVSVSFNASASVSGKAAAGS